MLNELMLMQRDDCLQGQDGFQGQIKLNERIYAVLPKWGGTSKTPRSSVSTDRKNNVQPTETILQRLKINSYYIKLLYFETTNELTDQQKSVIPYRWRNPW